MAIQYSAEEASVIQPLAGAFRRGPRPGPPSVRFEVELSITTASDHGRAGPVSSMNSCHALIATTTPPKATRRPPTAKVLGRQFHLLQLSLSVLATISREPRIATSVAPNAFAAVVPALSIHVKSTTRITPANTARTAKRTSRSFSEGSQLGVSAAGLRVVAAGWRSPWTAGFTGNGDIAGSVALAAVLCGPVSIISPKYVVDPISRERA